MLNKSRITTENLREKLSEEWNKKAYLTDEIIDQCVISIIKKKELKRATFLSALNIEIAIYKDAKMSMRSEFDQTVTIKKIVKTLKIDLEKDWKSLVIPIHGGLHWSCLLYKRKKDLTELYHLDSICGHNESQCKDVVKFLESYEMVNSEYKLWQPKYFQQSSNWECGFYTILAAYIFLTRKTTEVLEMCKKSESRQKEFLFEEMFDFFDDCTITYIK